jgi:hypothetical protein
VALYADVQACYCLGQVWLEKLSLCVEMEGHRPYADKLQNLVPGPGTNGSRHPLYRQGRSINPSGAIRCALALYKPSSKQPDKFSVS